MDIASIDAKRIELKVSQVELCREAALDPSTYTKLMQDPARQPRPRTVRKLEKALERFQTGAAA